MRTAKSSFAFAANAHGIATNVQRIVLFLLLLFSPPAALADGMVIPSTAYPAAVTIPDQSALICFSNGTERLVIETRFMGAGTNFAWVVPLPSQPVVEQATTGVFPTLQFLFRPQIVTDVPQFFPWISGLIWIGYVFLFVRATGRLSWPDILSCALVAICIASVHGTHDLPKGMWIGLGVFAFICLLLILTLLRYWRADMRALAVILMALFIALQLLAAFSYVPSGSIEPLLDQPAFWTFAWLDIILILPLFIWKEASRVVCAALLVLLILLVVAPLAEPARTRSAGISSVSMPVDAVSILQRTVVGIYDTTTVASQDATALQNWLAQNGYSVPANADPVIADYVKAGWVFVATKIRRDEANADTLTPHPLSFTFKTDKPVYPMRLTGLANKTLSVDLYVFSNMRAAAPHFRTDSCIQPAIAHPLLAKWTAGLPVATRLSATLSAKDMRRDVWLDQSPFGFEQPKRLYSREAAWTVALNRGAVFFAVGLGAACLFGFLATQNKDKVPALVKGVIIASVVIIGLSYWCLPRTSVRWVRGGPRLTTEQTMSLVMGLQEGYYGTLSQARAVAQTILHTPGYVESWDNPDTGEPVHEEDSPGNYVLRQTNNELELVVFDADGRPDVTELGPLAPSTLDSSKN